MQKTTANVLALIDRGQTPKAALAACGFGEVSASTMRALNARALTLRQAVVNFKRHNFSSFAQANWPNFVGGWFYTELFNALQDFYINFYLKRQPKLKLSVPPRHGKSETIIRFCVYAMQQSTIEIIFSTYSQAQANRISEKAKQLASSLGLFKTGGKGEWFARNGSCFRAVGRGGGITGTGCDLLVLDDMLKNSEEADSPVIREKLWDFYTTTAETRLSPHGAQIAIGTRWHTDDLLGKLGDGWQSILFAAVSETDEKFREAGAALHPARFSVARLEQIRANISPRFWSALYCQQPTNAATALIRDVSVVPASMIPPRGPCTDIVSIDCAFKGLKTSDSNSIQRWRIVWPYMYCIDAVDLKGGFAKLSAVLDSFILPTDYVILVEDKANGSAIIESLSEKWPNVRAIVPTESKYARLEAVSPFFESNHVHFSEDIPCLSIIKEQLQNFPVTANDDQVDACSQALNWAREQNVSLQESVLVKPWFA